LSGDGSRPFGGTVPSVVGWFRDASEEPGTAPGAPPNLLSGDDVDRNRACGTFCPACPFLVRDVSWNDLFAKDPEMRTHVRPLLLLPLVLVLACGCGGRAAKLSGHVTYKGQPVGGGSVSFYPKTGGGYSAIIAPDGTYTTTDLPPGEMAVAIETESAKGKEITEQTGGGGHKAPMSPRPGAGEGAPRGGQYVKIPDKYKNQETSGLSVTLTSGPQTKDFPLD
jgi:hypothetical protein